MCPSLHIFILFLTLWVTVDSENRFSPAQFERMTYCKSEQDPQGKPFVDNACKIVNNNYHTGGCRKAFVTLTDQGGLTTPVPVFMGLCYKKKVKGYVNCVSDDVDSTSNLRKWNYDSKSNSCYATNTVLEGKGSGRVFLGGSGGNFNFGIPSASGSGAGTVADGDGDVAVGVPEVAVGVPSVADGVPAYYDSSYYDGEGRY